MYMFFCMPQVIAGKQPDILQASVGSGIWIYQMFYTLCPLARVSVKNNLREWIQALLHNARHRNVPNT